MQPPKAKSNNADNSRRTPIELIEAARATLEYIDLDPASDEEANKNVKADRIIALPENGLLLPWSGRVFLNPPGGKLDVRTLKPVKGGWKNVVSSTACWWSKLVYEYEHGSVTEAIYIGFTLETFVNSQRFAEYPAQHYSFCVPETRIEYPSSGDCVSDAPAGGSVIVYLGHKYSQFKKAFGEIGYCRIGEITA